MEKYTNIKCCRLCKSEEIKSVIEFGETPLANSYPITSTETEENFPLTVIKCDVCGHVQLKETVNPEVLFSNYLYASSDSPSLLKHFKQYAEEVVERFAPKSVLEIGSNDGILLRPLAELGIAKLIGVEPAQNIADKSRDIENAEIYATFFTAPFASALESKYGKVDLVCANNVFAHVAQLDSLLLGIKNILHEDGVFIFENAYLLDTIKGLYFDQVYHEHLQYYGIKPLIKYLAQYGLEIFDIKRVDTQGGSFRIFAQHKSAFHVVTPAVEEFILAEDEYGLYDDETYVSFLQNLFKLKTELNKIIQEAKETGKTISCYGCPAKFALFSKYFDLDSSIIKYVVDDSPLKQGRFSPGKKIPIVSREYFINNPTDYCIISVWNMAEAIIRRNTQYKGKFVVPMPEVKII